MADEQPTIATEHWKPIPGWEGYYEASDHGRIRSVDRVVLRSDGRENRLRGKLLSQSQRRSGHFSVTMHKSCHTTQFVHRMVAAAFIGPCPDGMEVCHNNGDPSDNRLTNLRYGTRSDNIRDRIMHGDHEPSRRTHCPRGHALEAPNLVRSGIRRGQRICLACNRAQSYIRHGYRSRSEFKAVADSYHADIMRGSA